MVYIDKNGQVLDRRPWDLQRVVEIFTGLWFVMVQFFMTLVAPFQGGHNTNNGSNNRRGGGWGGGGGGGGGGSLGGGGNGNGGLRPNRRIGRVVNSMDCNIPGGG